MVDAGKHAHANLTVQLLAICMEGSQIVSADSIGHFEMPQHFNHNLVLNQRQVIDFLNNVRSSLQFADVVANEQQPEEQHNGETAGSVGV